MEEMLGSIKLFAGPYAPEGWVFCEGQLLSISQFTALFSVIGTNYGGDGRSNFGVPDLRGRVPVGYGNAPGRTPRYMGDFGGFETITLQESQMPAHTHTVACDTITSGRNLSDSPENKLCATNAAGNSYGTSASAQMDDNMLETVGSSFPHENMQPWQCINYIICVNGYYPPRS